MINILPLTQKTLVRRIRIVRLISTCLAGVIVLALVAVILIAPTLEVVRSRARALGLYSRELQASGSMVSPQEVAQLQARTKVVRERLTVKLPTPPLVFVEIIQAHTVPGVRLTAFDIQSPEKRMLQLRGTATTREALQRFVGVLEADTRIALVDSPITNFVKSSESEFTLTLTFTEL